MKKIRIIINDDKRKHRILKQIYRAMVRGFACLGCKLCVYSCPSKAIRVIKNGDSFLPVIDSNLCNGCLICNNICPVGIFYTADLES
ncbi:MAG: 4Fe-4S dicluster-binding protein [Candidatus Njordarchaeum guaymaensis]